MLSDGSGLALAPRVRRCLSKAQADALRVGGGLGTQHRAAHEEVWFGSAAQAGDMKRRGLGIHKGRMQNNDWVGEGGAVRQASRLRRSIWEPSRGPRSL